MTANVSTALESNEFTFELKCDKAGAREKKEVCLRERERERVRESVCV